MKKKLILVLFYASIFSSAYSQFNYPSQIHANTSFFNLVDKTISVDLDADGDIDILASSTDSPIVTWFENLDGLGDYAPPSMIHFSSLDSSTYDIQVADLDLDNQKDVVVLTKTNILWYKNSLENGYFEGPFEIYENSDTSTITEILTIDLNIDGFHDLLVLKAPNEIGWFLNSDGQGNFGEYQFISDQINSHVLSAADVDNDGDIDVVTKLSNDTLVWLENSDGNANFDFYWPIGPEEGTPKQIETGDIDGDGDQDIVTLLKDSIFIKRYENIGGG